MTEEEFARYYEQYKGVIGRIARKLARGDEELLRDLKQEGLFALWRLNLAKARVNEDAWIRQAVKFRMVDFLRKLNPRVYESLQAHLDSGGQIVEDPEDGDLRIVHPPRHNSLLRDPTGEGVGDSPTRLLKLLEDPEPHE
jgi:DNA-directed RNA polymerase specialized sigma24 family protein